MNVDFIYWYGHDSFRIDDNGKQIYIDPWKIPANAPQADYIFVTHSHYDHYSVDDVKKLSTETTKVICTHDVASKQGKSTIAMSPNETLQLDALKIMTIPAYNLDKPYHPKRNNWVGFIIILSDGSSVYHAGDTDFVPEMKSLQVDVALLPVSGTYVMTAEEAVKAANIFKPKVTIPMHFGDIVGDKSNAVTFKQGFSGETVIKEIVK